MDAVAIVRTVDAPRSEQERQVLSGLRPGDRITGRVVRVETEQRVLLDLMGIRVQAKAGFTVRQGETLGLKVLENGPLLHLQVVEGAEPPPDSPVREGLSQLLSPEQGRRWSELVTRIAGAYDAGGTGRGDFTGVRDALSRVNAFLEPLSLDSPAKGLAARIEDLLQNHGLFFESKLADLAVADPRPGAAGDAAPMPDGALRTLMEGDIKPRLLFLRRWLSQPVETITASLPLDADEAGFLRKTVSRLCSHIEQVQQRAAEQKASALSDHLFGYMIALQDQAVPLQLKVYYPRREKAAAGRGHHRIALLLQMQRLGMVRADAALTDARLHIHFFLEDETACDHIRQHTEALRSGLSPFFAQVQVTVTASREKIAHFHDEDHHGPLKGRIDVNA
jgi:hypothetical protein